MAIDYIISTGTHYIANSGSDENKDYQGGQAGDQTGHEAELRKWYSRPWTVVLRYPNRAVADKIADLSIAMCLNDAVGYDQAQRATYWQALKKAGYDPSKVGPSEQDCTAGISANVRAVGALMGIKALEALPMCSSRNMRAEFVKAGFVALDEAKYLKSPEHLLPGDVLLCENHHAAVNVTLGSAARETWRAEEIEIEGPRVTITGASVFVRKGPGTDYGALGIVHAGEALRYFGYDYPINGWRLVEHRGQTGWVSGRYARVE